MGDVYVEAGEVKSGSKFPAKQLAAAQAAAKQAIVNFVKKTSGMTGLKPASGAGVRVNVMLTDLVAGTNTLQCTLIADLFELPSKERFKSDVSPRGEGKVVGEKADVALAKCVDAAVNDMMIKITRSITTPPPKAGTIQQIYIAPFVVTYPKDAKKAPAGLETPTVEAVKKMMDALVKKNPRFVQDNYQSGMPGYSIKLSVEEIAIDTTARKVSIKTKGSVTTYPDGAMFVLGLPGGGAVTGDISDRSVAGAVGDIAKDAVALALKEIIDKN